ncbi:response regulator [Anaerolineae bacterium CFX7]|nr:response regulator [Anaerolineae bacterium CFX7]
MTPTEITALLAVIVSLIQAIAWPLFALLVFMNLRSPLKKFVDNAGEVSVKGLGVEATAKRQLEAAALLGAASVSKETLGASGSSAPDQGRAREIANVVSQAGKTEVVRQLSEATVLWVDDNPNNNLYERSALETLGIRFTLALSTKEALEKLQTHDYDVIISDMGRGSESRAGYDLLEQLKKSGNTTPFIIYSGSKLPQHIAEARQRGAFGTTNNPQELFDLVIRALESKRAG